jgi:chemotaxis protein CheX
MAGAQVVSNQFTTDDLTAIIEVSGRLEGNVIYGFSDETALAVARRMIGEDVDGYRDELGLLALGEIANMITGNAATQLSPTGFPRDISPPVIVDSPGLKFTTFGGSQILVTLTSSLGPLNVRFDLRPAPARCAV